MSGYFGPFVIPEFLATASDLATWMGSAAPANANAILRSCTTMVLDATEEAYYDVDETTGVALDPTIVKAMREATCIQAAAWDALKIDPATGGVMVSTVRKSKRIGSASFELADSAQAAQARAAAYTDLVPEAMRKLQLANLIGGGPWMFG